VSKNPQSSELFGQGLPPVAEEWTSQEVADADLRAQATHLREAVRMEQTERFMQLSLSQKHRVTYVAVREVRDVCVYLHREYNQLVKDISTILETSVQRIQQLEETVARLEAAALERQKEAEPRTERQLSLFMEDHTVQ